MSRRSPRKPSSAEALDRVLDSVEKPPVKKSRTENQPSPKAQEASAAQASAAQSLIFTIGRMNPPTFGHMELIKNLILIAKDLNQTDVYILLSTSEGEAKNPLLCSEKQDLLVVQGMIEFVKASIDGAHKINVHPLCNNDPELARYGQNWIMRQLYHIIDTKYNKTEWIDLYLIIGQDRLKDFDWIKGSLGSSRELSIIGLDRPKGAISGTYMRKLATMPEPGTADAKAEFIKNQMLAGLTAENALALYEKLHKRIPTLPETKPKHKPSAKKKGGKRSNTNKRRNTNKRSNTNKRRRHKKTIKRRK